MIGQKSGNFLFRNISEKSSILITGNANIIWKCAHDIINRFTGYGFYPFATSLTGFCYMKHFFILHQSPRRSLWSFAFIFPVTHFALFTAFKMSSSTVSTSDYRVIFDIVLMSLLFLLLVLTIALLFFKQKNVPVSQCIEVDPREPHSITITFVPAACVASTTNDLRNSHAANPVAASANVSDVGGLTQTANSASNSQTASIA